MTNSRNQSQSTDLEYQVRILQGVSRTFALTIPTLPDELSVVIGNAYLLCRIMDTIEDDPGLSLDSKHEFSERWIEVVAGTHPADEFSLNLSGYLSTSSSAYERDLIANATKVIRLTHSFNPTQRQALERCVRIMSRGMADFQKDASLDGLENLKQLDNYCYYVAGVVGEMLTELFCDYSPEINERRDELFMLAVSFGQALQMTNIIKDIWDDQKRGACWLPRDIFLASNFDVRSLQTSQSNFNFIKGLNELIGITRGHLANAMKYILIIPSHEVGIRKHCLWALGMAVLTLRRIHANPTFQSGDEVKISRRSVWMVVYLTSTFSRFDQVLKFFFNSTARSLPNATV